MLRGFTWLLIQVALAAADWTQFRGPNGSGISPSKGLPEHFDLQKNVVWRTELPPGHSSPVFTAGHIFVTAFEGKTLLTICLDRASGKIIYGRIPTGSVVVPGTLPSADGKYGLYCAVIVKQVDAKTRAKTGINELLRGE